MNNAADYQAALARQAPALQAEIILQLQARMDALWNGRMEKIKAIEKKDRIDRLNWEVAELTEKLEYAKKCLEYEKTHG